MNSTHAGHHPATGRPLRVREQARQVLAVMGFSAAASGTLALLLLTLTLLGR